METLIFTVRYEGTWCIVKAKGVEGRGEFLDAALQNWLDQRLYVEDDDDDQDTQEE